MECFGVRVGVRERVGAGNIAFSESLCVVCEVSGSFLSSSAKVLLPSSRSLREVSRPPQGFPLLLSWVHIFLDGFFFFSFGGGAGGRGRGERCGEGGVCAWLGTIPRNIWLVRRFKNRQGLGTYILVQPLTILYAFYILPPTIETFISDTWKWVYENNF